MAKKMTIAQQNRFLVELHTRPNGTTKLNVCRRFKISAQRGHHINNHHLSDPELADQLDRLRDQLLPSWGRRLAPPCFHLRQAGPVVTMGNVGLSHRFGRHSLFQESAKEKPATAGSASVEPEGELFQIRLQMGGND